MSNLNKGNKRKQCSTEEGQWKKISLEGEWEKISLKGEGEWRKISFDAKKEQEDEEKKKSIHHNTMLPLQDILKSKVSTPAVKPKVPTPVLKSKLPPPVLLPIVPPPVVMTNMAHSASISNMQHPIPMSNLPHTVTMSNLPHTVAMSNFQSPVIITQVSPSVLVSNLPHTASISNLHPPVMISNATLPASKSNFQLPVAMLTDTPAPSKSHDSTTEIRIFLESEKLNQKAISEPVFFSNISTSVQKSVTKPVELSDCILYLPDTEDQSVVRQNQSESNQIYVSGIPTYVSIGTVRRIFENCGIIKRLKFNGRDGCLILFDCKESSCKAVKLSGSRIRPKPNDRKHRGSPTKTLFVYFEKAVEDTKPESSWSKLRKKDSMADYGFNYTNKRGRQVSRAFKDETKYLKAIPDLIVWLKKGECKKETNNSFLSMMKCLFESQVSRLNKEAEGIQTSYSNAEIPVQQVMEKISVQLDDICKIFNCAKKKNVWCSFSKWQKKNLDLCRIITLELRKVHYQELIANRREVEMELSDEECDSDERKKENELTDTCNNVQTDSLGTVANISSQYKLFEKEIKLSDTCNNEDTVSSFSNKMTEGNEESDFVESYSSENHYVEVETENTSFQSNNLENSLDRSLEFERRVIPTTSREESDFVELYSSANHSVKVEPEDISFQSNNLENSVDSSLGLDERNVIPLKTIKEEDVAPESTVTSTVSSKIITDESEGMHLRNNNFVEIKTEVSSFNFSLGTSSNSSFKLPFLDSCYQEDIAESTVTSTDQSKMATDSEECDSNGISSTDAVSSFQIASASSAGSSRVVPTSVNPKEDCNNMNISQNELRLMILITSFLMICPNGASCKSVCQHLNNAQTLFETETVMNVLKKFPNLFREDCSRLNVNGITNWKFVGLNIR